MSLKNLIIHYKVDEPTPQIHGNSNRLPKHALSLSSVEYVVRFLVNYTDQHAIPLPGRIPGYKNTDLNLLPSSISKRGIWRIYYESAESV